jgi:hypothetical protein
MDIPSWCFRGAKVVCIDDSNLGPQSDRDSFQGIRKGEVHTIKEVIVDYVHPNPMFRIPGMVSVLLVGVVRPFPSENVPFKITRFKPVNTIETDMEEHFKMLLSVDELI